MKHWCDRELMTCPIYYCLITNEKLFKKELKRLRINKDHRAIDAKKDATTHFFEGPNDKSCAMIVLYPIEGMTENQHLALLVHEAVHVWQEIKKIIGESEPSKEFEAYSIQSLCQNLFHEWKRQTKRLKRV